MEPIEDIRRRLQTVADPVGLLEGLFAFAPVGLQVYRADGHSLLTNAAFRELFGADPPPEYNVLNDENLAASGRLPLVPRLAAAPRRP